MERPAWLRALTVLQLGLVGIIILAPLAWMVLASFKSSLDVTAHPAVSRNRQGSAAFRPHLVLLLAKDAIAGLIRCGL